MERKGEKKRKERIRRRERKKKGTHREGKGSERRSGKDILSPETRSLLKYLTARRGREA